MRPGRAGQYSSLGQRAEPVGQHGTRDAQVIGKVAESPHAEESVPQDQQGPSLAYDLQGASKRALLAGVVLSERQAPSLPG